MSEREPAQYPAAIPMLAYEDGPAAMDWLAKAFGFVERTRVMSGDVLGHGEMEANGGLIMMSAATPEYESPRTHRQHCERARAWSALPWVIDGVLVYVDDIDTHFTRARQSGATILSEIEDGGPGRRYRAEDPEGHRWMFLQRSAPS